MNVLHISRTMGQGGAEKIVYQLCESKDKNNKIVVSTGGYYVEKLKKLGIKHYTIPDIDKKNPIDIIKTFMILRKIIKFEKIDIIHSHHRMAAFYSRILTLFDKKIKRVYTAHNVFFNKKTLLRFSLKLSKIVAVGDGVKNNLINIYKINPTNIQVIYNSINVPNKVSKPSDDIFNSNKILIGTIGRISEQKGIDIFLKAMKKVIAKNKNAVAVVVGAGELLDDMKELTKELKISENVVFLGYREDIFDIISALDFVVLASRWEGLPLTPIETFSMKKTIVATNIDGNNEIVKDNYNGLLFEKDNVNECCEKILQLLKNDDLKNKLEKNAYKDFKEKFTYDVFLDTYKNLYNRIDVK